jgi:hypothetical protein
MTVGMIKIIRNHVTLCNLCTVWVYQNLCGDLTNIMWLLKRSSSLSWLLLLCDHSPLILNAFVWPSKLLISTIISKRVKQGSEIYVCLGDGNLVHFKWQYPVDDSEFVILTPHSNVVSFKTCYTYMNERLKFQLKSDQPNSPICCIMCYNVHFNLRPYTSHRKYIVTYHHGGTAVTFGLNLFYHNR